MINRIGSRAWNQPFTLSRRISQWAKEHKLSFQRSDLCGYGLQEQVQLFASADIVVAVHGAALTNIMFMRPKTVLIECFPPFYYEMTFETLATLARVYYIPVFSFQIKGVRWNVKEIERMYQKGSFYAHRRKYIDHNVTPKDVQIIDALDRAYTYIWRSHTIFEKNDQWSGMDELADKCYRRINE